MTVGNLAVVYCNNTLGIITSEMSRGYRVKELASKPGAVGTKQTSQRPWKDKSLFKADPSGMRPAQLDDFIAFNVEHLDEFQVDWSLHALTPLTEQQDYLTCRQLYAFYQLNTKVQVNALEQIVSVQRYFVETDFSAAKASITRNLHACINDKYFISRLLPSRAQLRRMENSRDLVKNMAIDHCMEFFEDGALHCFDGVRTFARFNNGQFEY